MGLISSKLSCPKDYNENKFNAIMKMYHLLDTDYDRALTTNNFTIFAKPFYQCEIEDLNNKILQLGVEKEENCKTRKELIEFIITDSEVNYHRYNGVNVLTRKQKEDIAKLERKNLMLLNKMKLDYDNKIVECEMNIKLIISLTNEEKILKLIKDIKKRNGLIKMEEIEFKHFYKYMKERNVIKILELILE